MPSLRRPPRPRWPSSTGDRSNSFDTGTNRFSRKCIRKARSNRTDPDRVGRRWRSGLGRSGGRRHAWRHSADGPVRATDPTVVLTDGQFYLLSWPVRDEHGELIEQVARRNPTTRDRDLRAERGRRRGLAASEQPRDAATDLGQGLGRVRACLAGDGPVSEPGGSEQARPLAIMCTCHVSTPLSEVGIDHRGRFPGRRYRAPP